MNILAHFLLSGYNEEVIVGNFIADYVRGKQVNAYSKGIIRGIEIHRHIDNYSDSHPLVRQTWSVLQPEFGHYGRVVTDMYYDHFLTKKWNNYSENSIKEDISFLYEVFKSHSSSFTPGIRRMVSRLVAMNWLEKYQTISGLHQVFRSMSRRVSFDNNFEKAIPVLTSNYELISAQFDEFFPQLVCFIYSHYENQFH